MGCSIGRQGTQNFMAEPVWEDTAVASSWIQQFVPLTSLLLAPTELVPHCPASLLIS